MERYLQVLSSLLCKIDRRHIQLLLVILAMILFVLAAGAPGAFGDFSGAPARGGF